MNNPPAPREPAWNHSDPAFSIRLLFVEPWWIDAAKRTQIGQMWIGAMSGYQIYLDKWASVKEWSVTIYDHLHSRNMPLTTDATQMWPDAATELLRIWINQGCRENESDPLDPGARIPAPHERPRSERLRRDIRSLSPAELDEYRARLDDVMRVGDASPSSPWQKLNYLHTNWCLHYQEAFLFWHRAYLLYFEQLLGMAVPYWNWMAADANIDASPDAGIPQAFQDLTYIHPHTRMERPNPLRFAAARDGRSKRCAAPTTGAESDGDCRWVQRNPLFYTSGDDHRAERERLIRMVRIFQNQVVNALKWPVFSQPEGWPGYPWANILVFDPPQPDKLYPNREDFDGLYEQPHDNWHGWIGFDMADNAYTAFDPIFWSYHANIDRMMEIWIRDYPGAQFTASFSIQPFVGPYAGAVDETDPRRWIYTTIGDLARDSRGLGYDFGPPVTPDWQGESDKESTSAANALAGQAPRLAVVFDGVRCTRDSYTIDAFLNRENPTETDVDPENPNYIGRFSRIGMGIEDEKGRCIRHGVTRMLDASRNAAALDLASGAACSLTLLVRDIASGQAVAPETWRALPGFEGRLVWGDPGSGSQPEASVGAPPAAVGSGGSCCSSRR